MLYRVYIATIFCIFVKNIAATHDYGPVDLPDGVQLQLGYKNVNIFPTHNHFTSVSRKIIHNGGIRPSSDVGKPLETSSATIDNQDSTETIGNTNQTPWITEITPNVEWMTKVLATLGFTNPPSMNRCQDLNDSLKIKCIEEVLTELKNIFETSNEILLLNMRILYGGKHANKALTRLNTISLKPQNRQLLLLLGSSAIIYFYLMRDSLPDKTRWLAQSVLSKLTDLPVASNIADFSTGGYGHINILIPSVKRVRSADRYIASLI